MIDFSKLTTAGRIDRALECSNVITMPFRTGNERQEANIIAIAAKKACTAKSIKISRFYSCILIEKIQQPELL